MRRNIWKVRKTEKRLLETFISNFKKNFTLQYKKVREKNSCYIQKESKIFDSIIIEMFLTIYCIPIELSSLK